MTDKLKYNAYTGLLCKAGICVLLISLLCRCNSGYHREDATENFNKNKKHFYDLINYLNTIKPKNPRKAVLFGYGAKGNTYTLRIYYEDGSVLSYDPNIGGPDIPVTSAEMDNLLRILNWNKKTLDTLHQKLEKTNCLTISTGDPVRMTFGEGKHGLFSYMIFSKPLPDSTITMYTEKYGDNVIDKRVVIIYTTGLM